MVTRAILLRGAGLSYTAVAAVLNLDYGTSLKGESVRRKLHGLVPADNRRPQNATAFRATA